MSVSFNARSFSVMRKIWLSAIAATAFALVSCAASGPHVDAFNRAQKAYNDGKDDKAIAEALASLKIKPDYKPAIEFLNKTFDDVIAAKNDTIAMFKKRDDPNPKRWDKIVYMEEQKADYAKQLKLIARRNDKIKLSVEVDPNDIAVARDSAAASHYAAGLEKMNERGKAAQQAAAIHFRMAFTYHSDYEDSKQLYAECKKKGTIRVAVDKFTNDYSGRMDAALISELQKKNFDHPDAFDWDLLFEQVLQLKGGKGIEQPVYSYLKCDRLEETIYVEPTEVIIIEGIMALYKKELRELMDLRIYVDADPDERLIRVIERDVIERGRTARAVMNRYREVLKPMHKEFIEPTKEFADVIIPQGGDNHRAICMMRKYIERMIKGK